MLPVPEALLSLITVSCKLFPILAFALQCVFYEIDIMSCKCVLECDKL